MSEPFLGQIIIVPYNFSPRGWAFCSGQILPIAQNTALFSLLGTTYGGNGQTTFALPDLRGRCALSSGQGPGLSSYALGQVAGTESATLNINQMPSHNHTVVANGESFNTGKPKDAFPATGGSYNNTGNDGTLMAATMVNPTGGNQPFGIMQPYLVLNYCIALEGIFPSRN